MSGPRITAVVVSYGTRDDLACCLASLDAFGGPEVQVVVVDNGSTDGSPELVAQAHPSATLIRNAGNEGFGRACNQGAATAEGTYLLFLNPDAQVTAGAADALARVLDDDPAAAIVGPRTLNDDGTPQVSFGPALGLWSEWRQRRLVRGVRRRDPAWLRRAGERTAQEAEPDWVSGSCLLVRRHAFEQLGGFDEGFFLYEEDVDLCVRARALGWRVRFEPRAVVRHRLGRSMAQVAPRARLAYHRSHLRYYRKHNGAAETLFLRMGLALASLAGWLRAAATRDLAGVKAHSEAFRLAVRGGQ